jgi:hypothetical protein
MLNNQELAAIDDWRFRQRMPSRAPAIRQLLVLGLKAGNGKALRRPQRSQDIGVTPEVDSGASEERS